MRKQRKQWRSTRNRFTLYGITFGLLFPLFSTLAETWIRYELISAETILLSQNTSPLLWVINTAPFFLGLFARIAGIKQEIGENINTKLNKTNKRLKLENIKRSRIEAKLKEMLSIYTDDLHSARLIQEFGLPEIPIQDECKFSYKYLPLNPVGGDFVSLIKLKEGGISILVGDVVGHGISAALITSLVKVLSNKNCKNFGTEPIQYMQGLNREVIYYLPQDFYLTALYGYLSFQNNAAKFNFSRGGHPYPFVYSFRDRKTNIYEIQGTPLGIFESINYEECNIDLLPGDRIYIITDGLLEIRNQNNKLLGHPGFANIITEACTTTLNLDESIEFIINKANEYSDFKPAIDDRLILGIEIF